MFWEEKKVACGGSDQENKRGAQMHQMTCFNYILTRKS